MQDSLNSKQFDLAELYPVMCEVLDSGGEFSMISAGNSMLPLLRSRIDTVVLTKPQGRLKKWDVPLYRRDNGEFILHRVLKVLPDGYVMCGDHQFLKEYGIDDTLIVAVLKAFIRDGKRTEVTDFRYRLYVVARILSRPLRKFGAKIIFNFSLWRRTAFKKETKLHK